MKKMLILGAIVSALGAGSLSAGTIAVAPTSIIDNNLVPNTQSFVTGWAFTTTTALNVVALDYYDQAQNGLLTSHTVGIYSSTGTLLVSATIPSGTAGGLNGVYRDVAIPTFALGPGSYVIAGTSAATPVANTADPIIVFGTGTPIAGLTIGTPALYAFAAGLVFPTAQASGLQYFNANFEVGPIPEPATYGMVLSALAAFVARKRMRS